MKKLIDLESYPVKPILSRLLQDKTTKQNIIFATDAYAEKGADFRMREQLTKDKLVGFGSINLTTRVEKAVQEQQARTKKKAEVFTPSWIVNKMVNHCDEEWFGHPNVFNTEDGISWITNKAKIEFSDEHTWQEYVDSRRIEITCGEAPYIISRYDAATGAIIPVDERIGMLDRKLRVVNENAADDDEWFKWTERALQSTYGYEYQGDNLLIARINVLLTLVEHYELRFKAQPDIVLLRKYANTICWNFWQMNGITGTIPFTISQKIHEAQMSLCEEFFDEVIDGENVEVAPVCKIRDWRADRTITYEDLKRRAN